ncbi:tetraacyldisaccharide 4'-kinase [Algoriphagus sp. H41]|uniref:Tetraacyldisaccharide 4'-kinase n=1 Tax=Algoriphagus oliviformis TaxID=2811231 RepID=A0ABS3C7U4_9BACT|nr:tetraacyldisaccharide 4'-kinase [Algoriphagus oliviformis]MBN7812215.1 tetraacyldisaccharide 4'-kinase [Algoriphagus oliviformis]
MPWYAFLLAPFALIFRVVTGIRNWLYDLGLLKSFRSPVPTLIVGNLSVGGTGKTPMVEFLIKNLRDGLRIASLSRGYGRKSKGFLAANPDSTAEEVGDEPLQIFRKFGGEVPVFVGEDRVAALERIAREKELDLVVLDDAFQHRRLRGDAYILLTPFSMPFSRDFILPVGRLRESRPGARRADLVVVTKCPRDLSPAQKQKTVQGLRRYLSPDTAVLFSKIDYGTPYALGHDVAFSGSVVLLSGLADDRLFVEYCREAFDVLEVLAFPDHHDYEGPELDKIAGVSQKHPGKSPVLLTTEKDAVKLKSLANRGFLGEIPIFVLPVEARFEPEDKQMLLSYIREKFRKK